MATREELGLKVGDHAVWAYAFKVHSIKSRAGEHIINVRTGTEIDTPGAVLTVAVGQVKEIKPNETVLQVVASYTDEISEPDVPGRVRELSHFWAGYLNDRGKGDLELEEKLKNAGIRVSRRKNKETGGIVYSVKKVKPRSLHVSGYSDNLKIAEGSADDSNLPNKLVSGPQLLISRRELARRAFKRLLHIQ